MALAAGTRLGPYEITGPLGAGGMGEVYRATDTSLKREVAIKVLPQSLAADADRLARFQREAEVLAPLNHPNIAQIYGLERSDGTTAIAMELVEGPTLADRIAQGAVSLDEALGIATQIADALEVAHERGIVHRDLKPANVKLRPDGTVKVLDFGIAKALDTRTTSSGDAPMLTTPAMTEAGVVLGTAAYMSPEQARGKPVDQRTDVWAFGCVLYEMLTGQLAFGGEDVTIVLARVLERSANLDALPGTVSSAIRRTLELCFEKDPRKRIRNIGDVKLALGGAFAPRGGISVSVPVAWWQTRTAVMGVGLVAVLALAALLWFTREPLPSPPETHVEIDTPATKSPMSFAISPDGRRLVYAGLQDGRDLLWVRSLDSSNAAPLAGTENAIAPFWSADSRTVAFFKDSKLKAIDVGSGAVRDLADAIGGRGGTWGALGDIVFSPTGVGSVMRLSSQGGQPVPVTHIEGTERHFEPRFLPDSRSFLFFVSSAEGGSIYAAKLGGGPAKRIADADSAAAYAAGRLLFVRQGRLFAQPFDPQSLATAGEAVAVEGAQGSDGRNVIGVSASPTGVVVYRTEPAVTSRRQLAWFDRSGTELVRVADDVTINIALAPDEQHVAATRVTGGNSDIWTVDLGRGVVSRFTTDPAIDSAPLYSADGERLIFQRFYTDRGAGDILWRPVAGVAEEALISDDRGKIPTDVSRDGRWLLFKATPEGGERTATTWDLWAMRLTGDRRPIPVRITPFNETDGQFSPDGDWVLFQSDQSGQYEVYLQPFGREGEPVQVSIGGGAQPRWRADGQELYYVALDGRLMAVSVEPSEDSAKPPRLGRAEALFATDMGPVVSLITRQRYVPSRDGQRFLMNVAKAAGASPLRVILNYNPTGRGGA
jgi:serine/threonine protein kinase